ncbi:MAG: S-methyl-5-thioribose-1-phosphate isomerase [Actinomycetota bacterium]
MRAMTWQGDSLHLIDQTQLPHAEDILAIQAVPELVAAIMRLSVRGAPALGVAGAYGVVLAMDADDPTVEASQGHFAAAVRTLRDARPTAVNLARMVDRVASVVAHGVDAGHPLAAIRAAAVAEATAIHDAEVDASRAMGEIGADLVADLAPDPAAVRAMTVCNTGGLAAVERGTALAVIQTLHERGALTEALAVETRPLLQGGRLTTWELGRMGAPHRLCVDGAGPFLLARGAADVVLIGADRVAANGDTANKIGSFSLALGAAHAGVPFVVVAPESTLDPDTPDGTAIPIEDRGASEVTGVGDHRIAPEGTDAANPAFDVTPVSLITALVTERRVVRFDRGETL